MIKACSNFHPPIYSVFWKKIVNRNILPIKLKMAVMKSVIRLALYSNSEDRDIYWRRSYSVPSKFLKNFSNISFLGRKFNCPENPKEYLEYAYGDWKKPIRTSDKDLYNSNEYYKTKKITLLQKIKNITKKIFK